MSRQRRLREYEPVILRLQIAQGERAVSAFGEKGDCGTGGIEESADAARRHIRQIGQVPGDRNGRGNVNDSIGVLQCGRELGRSLVIRLQHVAGNGRHRFAEEPRKPVCERRFSDLRAKQAVQVVIVSWRSPGFVDTIRIVRGECHHAKNEDPLPA